MAQPIQFIESNASFIAAKIEPYAIWVRDYQLGQEATIESLTVWEFSGDELTEVLETGLVFIRLYDYQPPICLFNAEPTQFEGSRSFTHKDCRDLPTHVELCVFDGRPTRSITSAWQLNTYGRQIIREHNQLLLSIVGGQRDVEVFGKHPSTL